MCFLVCVFTDTDMRAYSYDVQFPWELIKNYPLLVYECLLLRNDDDWLTST